MSPKTSNMAARLRPAKTPAIAVRSASFRCAALVFHSADFVPDRYATRNRPNSLMGGNPPEWLTLHCWAARTAGPGCPFTLHAGQPSAPLHPRRVSAESASNESSRPGIIGIVPRLRWHEGPTGTTLLAALRGWAPVLLPVRQTTHIVRSFRSFLASHLYSFRAGTPRTAGPSSAE
jgi:hypothetical protein